MRSMRPIHIIGGGLAGSEAAWQIARRGAPVVLHEMRPFRSTAAHRTEKFAELVCSNSFRSDDAERSAIGLLHAEMRRLGSLVMRAADANKLPAGGALAVDREGFAAAITAALEAEPLIDIRREEVLAPPPDWDNVIIATGPLTSPALAETIRALTGEDCARLLRRHRADRASRLDRLRTKPGSSRATTRPGRPAPAPITSIARSPARNTRPSSMRSSPAKRSHSTISSASEAGRRRGPYFDGCLPIEVMAERGRETLRHGPMKPFGLTDPHRPAEKPYAVVQLRQDNKLGTLFNMVGFQTKLKHGEQVRIFRTIPGLAKAEFARLGGLHRNTFLNSPRLLDETLRLKAMPRLRFAGQITGCEGYVESAAIGLLAGRFAAAERLAERPRQPPPTTAHGALLGHITGGHIETIDCRPALFSADERQFRLVPAARTERSAKQRQETGALRACARRPRHLDRRGRAARGRVMLSSPSRKRGERIALRPRATNRA